MVRRRGSRGRPLTAHQAGRVRQSHPQIAAVCANVITPEESIGRWHHSVAFASSVRRSVCTGGRRDRTRLCLSLPTDAYRGGTSVVYAHGRPLPTHLMRGYASQQVEDRRRNAAGWGRAHRNAGIRLGHAGSRQVQGKYAVVVGCVGVEDGTLDGVGDLFRSRGLSQQIGQHRGWKYSVDAIGGQHEAIPGSGVVD